MAVAFTKGGITTFTCSRDPAMGSFSTSRQWKNPAIRSAGGTAFSYNKGVARDIITLTWKYINKPDLLNCLAFLRALNFSADSFTFVDPAGSSHTAWFWGPSRLAWNPIDVSTQREFTIELLV